MLKDGYGMSSDEGTEEYEEVQQEVDKAEANDDLEAGSSGETGDTSAKENQQQPRSTSKNSLGKLTAIIRRYLSPIFIQALVMTFLAVSVERINHHILYISV